MEEKKITLEEVFSELDEVINKLQTEDTSLEETVTLYAKGMELIKESDGLLEAAEKTILKIDEEGNLDEF